ncbi:MAG: serine hydrolase, partial [Bacteroidota bacterium]
HGEVEDWRNPIINLSMTFEPDSRWVYNDACAMLCAAIIEKTSGKSLSDFAREHLFTPLGEREFYWFQNASGTTGGMGNLYISNLTFAKLGLLVLNKGKYQGKQIISSSWIEQCMTPALDLNDDWPEGTQYGFFWYLYPVQENGKTYQCAYATGNGGNKVFVLPELNMVLAVQSSAYGQGYGHGRAWYILYALLRALK